MDSMSYRLLSYRAGREARAGILVGEQVYDSARLTGQPAWSTVFGALQEWAKAHRAFAAAAKRIAAGKSRAKGTALTRVKLLAPVLYPGNIYCAGANYTDHMAEMARAQGKVPGPNMKELGEKPWHFVKTSKSSVVGPGASVRLPAYSQKVDWEVELVAVLGRAAKDVPVDKALDCVAGYTIANDLSARDAMKRDKNPATSPFHFDWVSQKCFDGAGRRGNGKATVLEGGRHGEALDRGHRRVEPYCDLTPLRRKQCRRNSGTRDLPCARKCWAPSTSSAS